MGLKIVAAEPGETRFLLVDENLPTGTPPPADAKARVLDAEQNVLFEPGRFHSITAHCPYFRGYDADEGTLADLLDDVDVRGPPADALSDD